MIRAAAAVALLSLFYAGHASGEAPLRAGIVGCDTSHVIAFTTAINDPAATGRCREVQVVAAFPGGSPDLPQSRDRVEGYTKQLADAGVEIVATLAELRDRCDVFLLESVDGRVHLEQFREIAIGKPVFIDKPAAASLADLIAIFRLAERTGTPCFTTSALRYCQEVTSLGSDPALGKLVGCSVTSPLQLEPHHPDLYWYGIHGVESIYALMGPGCEEVSRLDGDAVAVVSGRWSDGRVATYHGAKRGSQYAFMACGEKGSAFARGFSGYGPLIEEICSFFVTKKPPVAATETIEMFAFMEAADESLRREGRAVKLQEMIRRAEEQLAAFGGGSSIPRGDERSPATADGPGQPDSQ